MKECPNCHAQIEDDSLFCTECGKSFTVAKTCPYCGAPMKEGDVFCQNCGKMPDVEQGEKEVGIATNNCPHCGASMNKGDVFCQNCGKKPDEETDKTDHTEATLNCPYCGAPVNKGDIFCQSCGNSLVWGTPTTYNTNRPTYSQYNQKSSSSSNIGKISLFLLGVILLAAICIGGFCYYKYDYAPKKAAEEARILAEQEKAAAIQRQDSLDQVLWQKTIEKDDEEAYQLYLQKFPLGKHAEQAKKRVDYAAKLKLTSGEEYEVQSKIQSFFNSISNGYEDDMISYLSPSLTSFLGKKNASKVDAMAYLHKIHSDDVYSVKIMMGDINVKKELDSEQNPKYTATFNYDQRIEREDTSQETFASIKGTATLNNLFKITSLALTKTASY